MSVRAFARRSLLAWVILAAAACGSIAVCDDCPVPASFNEAVPAAQVQAAWNRTLDLMARDGAIIPWKRLPTMTVNRLYEHRAVPDEPGHRYVGMHFLTQSIDRKGRFKWKEKIEIYLLPHEECFLEDVLVHEMLHVIHSRYMHINVALDTHPEAFVNYYLRDLDNRPCSERNQ